MGGILVLCICLICISFNRSFLTQYYVAYGPAGPEDEGAHPTSVSLAVLETEAIPLHLLQPIDKSTTIPKPATGKISEKGISHRVGGAVQTS